jgi:cytochrome c-type biogenesis protein
VAGVLNPALGFAAGALTILSPCVLPLIPIVLGGAAQGGRWGPLALAAGLVLSFTAAGFGLAALGVSGALGVQGLRITGAGMLALFGIILLVPRMQHAVERLTGPVASWAGDRQAGLERHGLIGQAAIGALLGLVWSPCVGPTLGAATVLAAQGENLAQAGMVMFAFGLGIASMLLLIALAGRSLLARVRGRLLHAGSNGRRVLGALLLGTGIFIGTGLDRIAEAALVRISPDWLITASTMI